MKDQFRRILCNFLAFLILCPPQLLASGGIQVDAAAPARNRASLDAAQNGVPVVNIARPNGGGLSHNKFSEFNVDTRGVIINNSVRPGVSQLGGTLTPNGNLGGRAASTILNEVTGTGRTRLDGYTEIFGARADYIMANPNGISINGGGFINTPSVTLSTGRPRFEADALTALDVAGGDILVEGQGVNADNVDAFTLVTRAARINADIHARRLDIVTGRNSYNSADGSVTALAPDGSGAPAVSIDSSALGGMYAGRIRLVGTEKGVGVNLQGLARATEDIFLQADGDISVQGGASADRALSVTSQSGNVGLGGFLAAGESGAVTAAGAVRLASGTGEIPVLYASDLSVTAGSLDNAGGRILAEGELRASVGGEAANSGVMQSGVGMVVNAGGAVRNSGEMLAGEGLDVAAGGGVANSGTMHAGGAAAVRSAQGVANGGDMLAGESLSVEAGADIANTGRLQSGGSVSLRTAGGLENGDEILARGPVVLESAGAAANTGAVRSEAGVRVASQTLANSGAVEAGGDLSLAVTSALENSGTLFSGGDAGLRAGNVRNEAAGRVASLGSLSVETGADIENSGSFGAGDTLGVHAGGSLRNAGEMLARSSLEVESRGSLENTGVLHSGGSGSCRAVIFLANSGDIMGVGDLFLGVASDMRNSGVIQSAGNIVFSLGGGLLNSGGILSRGSLDLDLPGDAVNTGVLGGDTDVALRAGGSLRNSAGARMLAGNGLDVNARTGVENAGLLSSGGALCAGTAGGVVNTGDMLAGAGLAVDAGTDVDNEGRLHSGGAVAVRTAGDLSNSGEVLAKEGVNVGVGGSLANAGTVSAEAGARVEAGTLSNEGVMEAGGGLAAVVAGSLENLGRLFSGETLELLAVAMRNLASGVMESLGGTRVTADADIENAGSIAAGESLVVRGGGSLRNTGDVRTQSAFDAAVSGSVENAGSVQSGGGISVHLAASLSNSGEVLAVGDAAFGVGGDLSNTGVLHSGGASSYELGGGLGNDGRILSHGTLNMIMAGDAGNTGLMAGDADVNLHVGGVLLNAVVGELVSGGDMAVSTGEDLRNQGRAEAGGSGAYAVGGGLFNDGRMLARTGLAFDVTGLAENPGVLHSGDGLAFAAAGLVNGGQILAQGDGGLSIGGDLTNTGFLFAGGAAAYGVDGLLHNNRGQILSLGDMLLAGTAGSMAGLLNEAGTIESLEGSMSIRAASVRNENPDFVLTPGTDIISRSGGIYSFFSDNWDQAQDLYEMLPSAAEVSSSRNALIIVPAELTVLGLGLDRNAFPRAELDAAIAAAEERFAASGGTPEEVATVASLKNRLISKKINVAVQHFKDRSKVAAYIESVTRDEVSGQAGGATIAAAGNLDIKAQSFINSVSTVSTASGDIRIDTETFSNAGQEVYEHRTIEWARGHANEHQSPRLAKEGGGVEVVDTPVGHAYGVISAGGDVTITADHLANGIAGNAGLAVSGAPGAAYSGGVDSQGAVAAPAGPLADAPSVVGVGLVSGPQASVIAPPRPEDLSPSVDNLEDLIGDLPTDGLFSVNTSPGHRYLIETNPALTSMSRFYGSDYFLDRLDVDLAATQRQLLGDAFYETRLVRDQIFALTGRRLLSSAFTSDAQQMRALLDNAVAVQGGLGLSVGVSLTAGQVAALDTDIVWLETRVVDGHEVLAPVVYLCSGSLETIARGGAVIVARNVDVNTTGDTANGGVIQALGELAVTARNIFNSFGTLQGGTVNLAATETLRNTSGLIQGGDVSITAGRDIINDTASTSFSQSETTRPTFAFRGPVSGAPGASLFGPSTSTQTTSETVGRRGAIEATGDLAIQAGNDIAIEGGDVRAGGDISMKAGGDVLISARNLESHSTGKTGSAKSGYDTRTGKSSTVAAGGYVDIAADGNVVVHGSTVTAGEDATVAAGESVSVMAATEGHEYRFKQSKDGGMFGTSRKESTIAVSSTPVVSALTAGDRVVVEAGKGGAGDLTVTGSRVESGGDTYLVAESGIVIMPVRVESYSKVESEESGFMGTGSMKLDESQASVNARSEIAAGGKVVVESRGDLVLQSARLSSGAEMEITARNGAVGMLAAKDVFFERHVESETGYFSWSSSDKGAQDETVQHTEIASGTSLQIVTSGGVVVEYRETGDVRRDIGQLAQAPGLAWMGELLQRDDVDWRAVQEVHDRWKEEQSGFGGPGVQLVSLAVAVALTATGIGSAFATWATGINTATGAAAATAATSGAAAGAAGATVAGATTAASLTATQLAIHSAVAAGFNALVTQASVQLIGNQGDIGATLEALASMDTVRSLATAMLTAGLTSGLMDAAGVANDPGLLSQAEDMTEVMDVLTVELQRAAIRGVVSAGVDTAINGGDLGQNLVYQMQAAGVAVLGSQGARAIGTAFKDQEIGTATKYIAHAALGGTMDLAMGGDGTSGALGAVAGELIADTYVNAWIGEKISQTEDYKKLSGDELRKELDKLEGEIAELRRRGVDLARLGAGMAAALTGGDIDIAAQTGGNAAEHNALPVVLIVLGVCEAVDVGIKLYNAYKLAEAIQDQDEAGIEHYGTEILIDTAVDAAPLGAVFTKLGMTKVGGIIMGLGAKVGDEAVGVASKSAGRNLPFKDVDRITEVNKTLDRIESGGSFPYKRDGIVFKNKDGILPEGNYREYTVETPGSSNRGTRRIVQDADTGKTYYTDDHYRNFIQIDPTKR